MKGKWAYFIPLLIPAVLTGSPCALAEEPPPDRQLYVDLLENFRKKGINAHLADDRETITFTEGDLEGCREPVCKILRRMARKAGPIRIQIEDAEHRGGPSHPFAGELRASENTLVLNPANGGLSLFYSGKGLVFRHEFQHWLFSSNRPNHMMNGVYAFPGFPGSDYNRAFWMDELLAFTDGAVAAGKLGRVDDSYRLFGRGFVIGFTQFIEQWKLAAHSRNLQRYDWPSSEESPSAEEIGKKIAEIQKTSSAEFNLLQIEKHPAEAGQRYEMIFFNKMGQRFSLYSDYPYAAIQDQIPTMLAHLKDATSTWLKALTQPDLVKREDLVRMKRLFKDPSDEFRFKPSCAGRFGAVLR